MTITDKKFWDKKIETLPRKELEKYQLRLLNNELNFARKGSPYYKKVLPKKH